MCGPAGSGKSTWVKEHIKSDEVYISRDAIRFDLVRENENYFSKEKIVFDRFVNLINKNLAAINCNSVYADATHISPSSRKKLINQLNLNGVDIIFVSVYPDVETCVKQNSTRQGRTLVPESVVRAMHEKYIIPSTDECPEHAIAVILVN